MSIDEFCHKYGDEIKVLLGMCGEEEDFLYVLGMEIEGVEDVIPREDLKEKREALIKKIEEEGDDVNLFTEFVMLFLETMAELELEAMKEPAVEVEVVVE